MALSKRTLALTITALAVACCARVGDPQQKLPSAPRHERAARPAHDLIQPFPNPRVVRIEWGRRMLTCRQLKGATVCVDIGQPAGMF
jgi:phage portal protein BeeE